MWVVVDADFELQPDAAAFLASVRGREDASVNTERAYAGQVALYLSYCAERGVDWADPSVGQLSAFLNWLVDEPWSSPCGSGQARERFRSKGTANAITGTVFRFLRFCSLLDDSPVPADVAARMYEPRYLAFTPSGYDRGEDGQYAVVNVRTVRFRVAVSGYEYLTDEEARVILGLTAHARDRLLVALLAVTGMRIGEALGLRREDMHLLSSSRTLGCPVKGPHVHVRRRHNANGALSKARRPRWIPVGEDIGGFYADYQWERTWSSSTSSRRRRVRR
jgi:site-specific recombinase XerD